MKGRGGEAIDLVLEGALRGGPPMWGLVAPRREGVGAAIEPLGGRRATLRLAIEDRFLAADSAPCEIATGVEITDQRRATSDGNSFAKEGRWLIGPLTRPPTSPRSPG